MAKGFGVGAGLVRALRLGRVRRFAAFPAFGLFVVSLCGGCGDCEDELAAADAFIAANLSCTVDEDCTTVSGACADLQGNFCGAVAINREAAESERWKTLHSALKDCSENTCDSCAALLVPRCNNGICRGSGRD